MSEQRDRIPVGTKFIVKNAHWSAGSIVIGDVLTLTEDDLTDKPLFEDSEGGTWWFPLEKLKRTD